LRWLADVLGPARNLDVFRSALLGRAPARLIEPDQLRALAAAVARRRRASYTTAVQAIRSPRYTGIMLRLLRWFDGSSWQTDENSEDLREPISILAVRVLDRRLEVVGRRSEDFADQYPEQRHRLRIALKKLRYASEALAKLYDPDEVRPFVRRLKQLQDDLGEISDVRVAHHIVTELSGPDTDAIVEAGKRLVAWNEEGLEDREASLRKHLDDLLKMEPFWVR
jgi:CHAD domain-containing protein